MTTTARQMSHEAKGAMIALSKDGAFGSMTAVYESVSKLSGLSVSLLMKFVQGQRSNLSIDSLDRLRDALQKLGMNKAA